MRRAVIFIAFLIIPGVASARKSSDPIEYRFNFSSDQGEYVFKIEKTEEKSKEIHFKSPNDGSIFVNTAEIKMAKRSIKISCIIKCVCKDPYVESIGTDSGWPSGSGLFQIFQVQDQSRQLVTVWASTTSYNLAIYACYMGTLQRILALNSRSIPVVRYDIDGYPEIEFSPDYDRPKTIEVLHWNGKKYTDLKKP